ncbi:MAG TPA: hypothetical protein VNI54_02205 [Thermoanaerobaculia bacterium]|nr:hypothetical protein [Thermoanaerobaculia bacterium]
MITATLLLAASFSVKTWTVPGKRVPTEIVRHGNEVWFVAWTMQPKTAGYFGRVTKNGRIRMMQAAPEDHMPGLTTHAPDGTLWLGDASQPVLWRVSRDGRIAKIPSVRPTLSVAFGPDGNIWAAHHLSAYIGVYGQDGKEKRGVIVPDVVPPPMTSMVPPLPAPQVSVIVAGPDGAMWFTETYRQRIGRVTTTGEVTMFDPHVPMQHYTPIVAGVDGTLYFTTVDRALGRITTSGEVTTVPIGFHPWLIEADSRGRIWYASENRIGIVGEGEFELAKVKRIRSMSEGPDGAMWIADDAANQIARITVSGASASLPRTIPAPRQSAPARSAAAYRPF